MKTIQFDKELLSQARCLFPTVYVDKLSEDGGTFIGSKTGSEGVRVRIFFTEWEYEEAEIVYNNEQLADIIQNELSDRAWYLQHEIVVEL